MTHRMLKIPVSTGCVVLAMFMAGCVESAPLLPGADQMTNPRKPPSPEDKTQEDCDGISSLTEKRACFAKQAPELIEECERIRPMHCKPYHEMNAAEKTLSENETRAIESARKSYASYAEDDAAYLKDLESSAREADRAWQAYREAQCRLEPFAQGMSRTLAEDLSEACRLRMTKVRIDEIKRIAARSEQEAKTSSKRAAVVPSPLRGVWYLEGEEGRASCRRYLVVDAAEIEKTGRDPLIGAMVISERIVHRYSEYGEGDFFVVDKAIKKGKSEWALIGEVFADSLPGSENERGASHSEKFKLLKSGAVFYSSEATGQAFFRCGNVRNDLYGAE